LLYFQTNASADKEKVVTVDIANEDSLVFKDLIPEDKEAKLNDATIVQDKIVVVYSRNVCLIQLTYCVILIIDGVLGQG
jgi:protease II